MWAVVERVEPVLSYVRQQVLDGVTPPNVECALEACAIYLDLYRPPEYRTYNPATAIRARCPEWEDDAHLFSIEPVHDCVGDASQVLECLRVLVQGAIVDQDSAIAAELFERDKTPCLALSFEGPGLFPDPVVLNGLLAVPRDELCERWTAATRGGRIDTLPNGLMLRLTGARFVPEPTSEYEQLREAVESARSACVSDDPNALQRIEGALAAADGVVPQAPADVRTIIQEVIAGRHPELTRACVVPDTIVAAGIPPIRVHRLRFQSFVNNAASCAVSVLPEGGRLTLVFEYNAAQRSIDCVISAEGKVSASGDACLAASMRRTIVDLHHGTFELAREPRCVSISASIPDAIGREVAEWIPGFEVFSDRSQQALRLLKSGGEALPEDLLLAGVLETELERWLLQRLADAATVNLAHDLMPDNRELRGSSAERLKKALEQIRRGKARKEIAKPQYAAEILYAFRSSERHRKAIGAERLSEVEIEHLCGLFLKPPPDAVACLRLLARVCAK